MFIGHFALAFAAKRVARPVSLGTLFLAAQFADLLWPPLVLLGIEAVEIQPGATVVTPLNFVRYPYSHSLVALLFWAALLGVAYVRLHPACRRTGIVIGALVLSHWFLDVWTHRPDMPVTIGGPMRLGLGLWNSRAGTVVVELIMFLIGVGMYAASTRGRDRRGAFVLWSLVGFLLAVYVGNVFGPPPPNTTVVAWAGVSMWLLILWGYWVDRHRLPKL